MFSTILVVCDTPKSLGLVPLARECAEHVTILDAGVGVDAARTAGADTVLSATDPSGAPLNLTQPASIAEASEAALAVVDPAAVFFLSTYTMKDAAAQLAVSIDSGVVADVDAVSLDDSGALLLHKSIFSGSWASTAQVVRGVAVATIRPLGLPEPLTGGEAEVRTLPVTLSEQATSIEVLAREEAATSGPVLTEAPVVVVGGRGVDGDFSYVRELAERLGGAVGATRVACDEGWIERSAQIGQTGATIAPQLYIGVGVSGAIHHTSGMQASQRIVAVCDDPDAPIFELADFGVVGDAETVIRQALEALN